VLLHDLAHVERAGGELQQAAEHYQQAADLKRRGRATPDDLAITLHALGRTWEQIAQAAGDAEDSTDVEVSGALKRAARAYAEALDNLNPEQDPVSYGEVSQDLADIELMRIISGAEDGDPLTARQLMGERFAVLERELGSEHLDTLAARELYAFWVNEAGDPATARAELAEIVHLRTHTDGADHPRTLGTRRLLAYITAELGDHHAARDLGGELLAILMKGLGPDHPDVLSVRHNHAHWTGEAGDATTACDLLTDLLAVRHLTAGPDDPDSISTEQLLIHWRGIATGDPEATRSALSELVGRRLSLFDPNARETLWARYRLAAWTAACDRHMESVRLTTQLLYELYRLNRGNISLKGKTLALLNDELQRSAAPGTPWEVARDSHPTSVTNALGLLFTGALDGSEDAQRELPSSLGDIAQHMKNKLI
jgi:hypothetical protein